MPFEAEIPLEGAINVQNAGMGLNGGENSPNPMADTGSVPGTNSPLLLGHDGRPVGSVSIGGIVEIK
ncbi:hypothetical protein, partial [uncultured Parasutterella sp.]